MRIGITGANGLFGKGIDLVVRQNHQAFPLTRADADLTDPAQVRKALAPLKLDLLFHPAGNPDPDWCELHPDEAMRINAGGTANLVAAAEEVGFALALISTDAVFDGTKTTPYLETDPTNPISAYGRSKLAAEKEAEKMKRHGIFRVSILFGPGKLNFVDKGLQKLQRGETYDVAADQVGTATYTVDVTRTMLEVMLAERYGLYHVSNQGQCSRLELGRYAARLAGLDENKIIGKKLEDMGRVGPRPKFSVMEMARLKAEGFALPRPWQPALAEYLRSRTA